MWLYFQVTVSIHILFSVFVVTECGASLLSGLLFVISLFDRLKRVGLVTQNVNFSLQVFQPPTVDERRVGFPAKPGY